MSYTRAPSSLSACCSGCAGGASTCNSATRATLMGDMSLTNPLILLVGGYLALKLLGHRARKKRAREYRASHDRIHGSGAFDALEAKRKARR